MTESILEASKKSQTHVFFGLFKRKSVVAIALLIILSGALWYFFSSEEEVSRAVVKKQNEWTVKKDDIKISIKSDGKVVAKDGVELSFSVSGDTLEVVETFVEEGGVVKKGDKIARVEADSLELSVRSAYASYQSALASYNDKIDGADSEEKVKSENDIKQAELSLEQAKISLERTKANAETAIKSAEDKIEEAKDKLDYDFEEDYENTIDKRYKDLITTLKSITISMEDILEDSDSVLGVDEGSLNDDFESMLGVKNRSTINDSENSYVEAKEFYSSLDADVIVLSDYSDHSDVDLVASDALVALDVFEDHLYDMQLLLNASLSSEDFSQNQLNSFKSSIASNRSSINSKISSLNSDIKNVSDAVEDLQEYKDDYEDNLADYHEDYQDALEDLEDVKEETARDIADAERNVETKELSLSEAKLNHEELLAPLTDSELASAKSQLTSAAVSLERAQNELEEATLVSPIDGEISRLNYKTGDTILKDDSQAVVSIINNDTLFIEVDIEEADINNLEVGQKAVAIFDALDDLELEGEISFISLTSETSNNGIVTYLVRVLFEDAKDSNVREGMTAYVDFITGGVEDVLVIPVDAVRNVNGSPSVQMQQSGEWSPVVTGFTDGDDVEIITGLSVGDKVLY